jgi:hypothetical protein
MKKTNDNTIELSHSYTDTYEGDQAEVTETAIIPDERVEDLIGKLVFQYGSHSEKRRWEKVKAHAERVEVERTVFRDG